MRLPKLRILIAAAGILLAAAVSCRKEDEPIPVITLKTALVEAKGGTQMITVAAQKSWHLSVEYESGEDWLHFSNTSGVGIDVAKKAETVLLTVDPNTGDEPRGARIFLDTPQHSISARIAQAGKSGASVNAPLWLELPALDQPELGFFTHSMDGGRYVNRTKSGVRNWSFYYDYEAYVSWWVAYPLNKGLIGSGSRTDSWQSMDPLLPASAVCDVTRTYGGGWTRGHQIPSADRLNYEANTSTFYPTNMTPQNYDFNCYIWADLEAAVRGYSAKSDTLYVVTGCDIRESKQWSGNNTGHSAKVPTHYYKALLRKKGSNYSAIAFHLPHSASISGESYMNYLVSVDELEQRTGVDFFVNLPTFLGSETAASIESADPAQTVKSW